MFGVRAVLLPIVHQYWTPLMPTVKVPPSRERVPPLDAMELYTDRLKSPPSLADMPTFDGIVYDVEIAAIPSNLPPSTTIFFRPPI